MAERPRATSDRIPIDFAPGSEGTVILNGQGAPPVRPSSPYPSPPPPGHASGGGEAPAAPLAAPTYATGPHAAYMPTPARPSAPPAAFLLPLGPVAAPAPLRLNGAPDPRLFLVYEPDSRRSASIRLLRDNLIAKGLPRSLAISSAARRDGKTTCALNLAIALADLPARVIVVDVNFFQPALAAMFAVDPAPAPSAAQAVWSATPYQVVELSANLHVAVIVPKRGEPPPRFESHTFQGILRSLVAVGYEHVILDAPALEVSPTVSQIVSVADATLLAVRAGKTTARALRRAAEQISPGKGIGLALVDAPPNL